MLYWELARNTTLSNVTVSVWFDMNSSQRNEKKTNNIHIIHWKYRIPCTELYNNKKIDKFKEPMAWSLFHVNSRVDLL